jgi:hypothetical protein
LKIWFINCVLHFINALFNFFYISLILWDQMGEKGEMGTVLTFTLAELMQFLPRSSLWGCTGYEEVTGNIPDISEFLDFNFWDLVWYCAGAHPSISEHNHWLGR